MQEQAHEVALVNTRPSSARPSSACNSVILLLDETTSALDSESEKLMRSARLGDGRLASMTSPSSAGLRRAPAAWKPSTCGYSLWCLSLR